MKKNFEEFVKKIRTKEELISLLEEILKIKPIIFKNKEGLASKKVKGAVSEKLKELIENLEKEGEFSRKNLREQSALLENLEKELESLPKIKLEIAFAPSENFLDRISQFIKKELGQRTILDLTINPNIVGGAIIEYRGNWRDFSVAKRIDELMNLENNSLVL